MISFSVAQLVSLLIEYRYQILVPLMIVEGPIVTLLASFLSSSAGGNVFSVFSVLGVVIFGDIVGDIIYYTIGRYGRGFFVNRYPRPFSIEPGRFKKIEEYFRTHGLKTVALGKVSHGLGWPTLVGAGSAKMPFRKVFSVSMMVTIPKSAFLVTVGYYYGTYYQSLIKYFGAVGVIAATVLIIGFFYFLLRRYGSILPM